MRGLEGQEGRVGQVGQGPVRSERGQAFVEYTMMLGLLAAIIIAITGIIVPAFGTIIADLVQHIAVYVSSV